MKTKIVFLIPVVLGFFFSPEILGLTGNILVKLLLLAFIVYLLFKKDIDPFINSSSSEPAEEEDVVKDKTSAQQETQPNLKLDQFSLRTLINKQELELNSYMVSQFEILFNYLMPTNGYVLIKDGQNDFYIFHKVVKNIENWRNSESVPPALKLFETQKSDLIVENNLSPQSNLIGYYQANYQPLSIFLMRTVITTNHVIYWLFDSPVSGFFNSEDTRIPVQVNFNIKYVFNRLAFYDAELNRIKATEKFTNLSIRINKAKTQKELLDIFVESITDHFEANKLTVALKEINDPFQNNAIIQKSIGVDDGMKVGNVFTLDDGLNGKVIKNNKAYLLENIEKGDLFLPRFSKNEKTNFGLKSFLSVPISINDASYGMITLEHKQAGFFNNNQKNDLIQFTKVFSHALMRFIGEKRNKE